MEIYYTSKGINNYLEVCGGYVADIEKRGNIHKIRMLENNEIPFLLSPVSTELNGVSYLKYNVSSYYVLEKLFCKLPPDKELLKIVLSQIIECVEKLENYLLDAEDLVIEPGYMFYESESRLLKLLCLPGYGKNIKKQLKEFIEYIMKIFDHRDSKGVQLMYEVYDLIVREDVDISSIKIKLNKPPLEEKQIHYNNVCVEDKNLCVDKEENYRIKEHKNEVIFCLVMGVVGIFFAGRFFFFGREIYNICIGILFFVGAVIVAALFSFKEEEDLDEIMEEYKRNVEAYLMESKEVVGEDTKTNSIIKKLVPLTNGALSDISLEKFHTIIIGRDKKDTDYRLATTQISRIHACIYCIGEEIFVEDKNSTNGTFINNYRIEPLTQYKIEKGDVVSFANEEFFAS